MLAAHSNIQLSDTLQRKGLYDPPPGTTAILGLEAAGVVEAVGVECAAGHALGDRVMVLVAGGGYADYVTVCVPRHISHAKLHPLCHLCAQVARVS